MKPRLIILVVLAGILAVTFAMRSAAPPDKVGQDLSPAQQAALDELHSKQLLVKKFPLPGEEPAEEPEFDVTVRVDTSTGHNRLVLDVTEQHGYYVDYFEATVWYVVNEGDGPEDSPMTIGHVLNRYLEAGGTLEECLDIVPTELESVGGSMGEDRNWAARINRYARAREKNPEKFPPVGGTSNCDRY